MEIGDKVKVTMPEQGEIFWRSGSAIGTMFTVCYDVEIEKANGEKVIEKVYVENIPEMFLGVGKSEPKKVEIKEVKETKGKK